MAKIGFKSGLTAMVLGAVFAAACGDGSSPSDGDDAHGGEGGSGGGKAGSGNAGSGNAGTKNDGGKAGSQTDGGKAGGSSAGTNTGGADTEPGGGQGGDNTDPPVTGAGGEGGGSPTLGAIEKLHDDVFTQANDLRGLCFSSSGKLWASGHVGINANPSPAGQVDKRLVLARFNPNGTPDTTFGGDGFLEVNLVPRVEDSTDPQNIKVVNDGNEESLGIVELSGGDVVVQVNVRDQNGKGMDVALARFTSVGERVTSFGEEGLARVTFGWAPADDASWTGSGAPSDNSYGLALDARGTDEKLVVFGAGSAAKGQTSGNPATQRTDNDRYIARVLASTGAADPGFNGGAAFTYNTGGTNNDNGRRGIVEADGSILSAGYTNFTPGGNHVVLIKLTKDGTRELGFGHIANDRGIARSNPLIDDGGVSEGYSVARQSNGRVVTTGYGMATAANTSSRFGYATSQGPDLVSLAFKPDGSALDTAWGNVGMFVAQSEGLNEARFEERGRDLLALPDDRLVYAGNFATDPAIFVASPDGEFDPVNGVGALFRYQPLTTTTSGTTVQTSHFQRVVASADGRRIAAATSQNVDGVLLAILEVKPE